MRRTHGAYQTKLYKVWASMKSRCLNPTDASFRNYGARGISVCPDWVTFPPFHQWALAAGYQEGLTIERIDNDGPYSPENCTWIPKGQQSKNTRHQVLITHDGKTLDLHSWADLLQIPYSLLQHRIRRGWSGPAALMVAPVPPHLRHSKSRPPQT